MIRIKLTKEEYDYCVNGSFLPNQYVELLQSARLSGNSYSLSIPDEQADQLRELFCEQLQSVGFNENYELTKQGEFLESMIDKFFVG